MVVASLIGASDIAQEIGIRRGVAIPPKVVSDLAFRGKIDCRNSILVSGRRLFPRDMLPQIERALEVAGVIPSAGELGADAAGSTLEAEAAHG